MTVVGICLNAQSFYLGNVDIDLDLGMNGGWVEGLWMIYNT